MYNGQDNNELLELTEGIATRLRQIGNGREWSVENSDLLGLTFLRSGNTKIYIKRNPQGTKMEIGVNAAHMVPWELNRYISLGDVKDPTITVKANGIPQNIADKMEFDLIAKADEVCAEVARRVKRHIDYQAARESLANELLKEWKLAGRNESEVVIDREDDGLRLHFPQYGVLPLLMVVKEDSVGLASRSALNGQVARCLVRALAEDLNTRDRKRTGG